MKTLKWIREGDPIPDNAKFLNKVREIMEYVFDCGVMMPPTSLWTEYLYEIPIDPPPHPAAEDDIDVETLRAQTS